MPGSTLLRKCTPPANLYPPSSKEKWNPSSEPVFRTSAIGAVAFTNGSEIHFAPGHYNPSTPGGLQMLGHELAHVVQQRAGRVRSAFRDGIPIVQDWALEAEADRMGRLAGFAPSTFATSAVQPKLFGIVQRVPVSLAVTETSQAHHPEYHFTTGTGPGAAKHKIDLDPWITRKGFGYDQKWVSKSQRKALKKLVSSWDCSNSIVNQLLTTLVGAPTLDVYDYTEARHSFVGADLARHLIALQENVRRRERDIPANCYNIDLETVTPLRVTTTPPT